MTSSLKSQISLALNQLIWSEDTPSPSRYAIRPDEKAAYMELCLPFFTCARALTGKKLLVQLMNKGTILRTLDEYYCDVPPAQKQDLLDVIDRLHQGCLSLKWYDKTRKKSPVTDELRQHVCSS
jgi:hypothetical protein